VLLVEDEESIADLVRLYLERDGFRVVWRTDGRSGLAAVDTERPRLVLLDLMLPGMDGFEVTRALREKGGRMPIIVVTAREEEADRVLGLELGADDYVTKPVVASELAARIRALLRRARPERPVVQVGDVLLHPDKGIATRGGTDVHLTRTELRLLTELAAAEGRVVTREQLLERVWGYDYFGDTRLLDVHVRRLRRKVEDDPSDPRLVLTVRGVGYRIAG